jgi:hypothetical protein
VSDAPKTWLNEYKTGNKSFHICPFITLKDWTAAYQWIIKKKEVVVHEKAELKKYYIASGENDKPTQESINTVNLMLSNSFDEFQKQAFSVWVV